MPEEDSGDGDAACRHRLLPAVTRVCRIRNCEDREGGGLSELISHDCDIGYDNHVVSVSPVICDARADTGVGTA